MMKKIVYALFILIMFENISLGFAWDEHEKLRAFTIMQSLSVGLSAITTIDPDIAGIIEVSLTPFIDLSSRDNKFSKELWPLYLGFTSLGSYNLIVDEDDTSKWEIFGVNYVVLNIIMLSGVLLMDDQDTKDSKISISPYVLPKTKALMVKIDYRF